MAEVQYSNPLVIGLGDAETDRNGSAIEGDWINMESVDILRCIMIAGGLGANISWQAQEASDNAGTGAASITGKTATHTNGTDENTFKEVEVRARELSAGMTHVRMQAADPGSASTYAVILYEVVKPRYAEATALTYTD